MSRRQTVPEQWAIVDRSPDMALWTELRGLPIGRGVLVLTELRPADRRRLRQLSKLRRLRVIEKAAAARVHDNRELRLALLRRSSLVLISPLYPTRSHPDWMPLPRMRAAALARLAGRKAIALGGMDRRRFRRVERLGFAGWAGIDAWRLRMPRCDGSGSRT
jgi:thiamine-phosphate pyrophosphorylase